MTLSTNTATANAKDRGDIEFTVCELNCHQTHEEQISPQHERKPRFSSFKKSAAISKAVRSKLNLSKSEKQQQTSTEKPSSSSGDASNSFDASIEKSDSIENNGKVLEQQDQAVTTPNSAKSVPGKVVKKKSKLCLLL